MSSEKLIDSLTESHRGMYLFGKFHGLDNAEFYLRHIHPCDNEEQKQFLRDVADKLRDRKEVVEQERKNLLAKTEPCATLS